jgi:hypothetical protein
MTLLLVSYVCDYCDGLAEDTDYHRGYIVWRGPGSVPGQEYVFRTPEHAERWRIIKGLHDSEVREVLCEYEFHWQESRGTVKGLELADRLFEIYPDHRFEPKPYRAFLAPARSRRAA